MESKELILKPIGIFRTTQVHAYEAGRQTDEHGAEGVVELFSGENFEQALSGIEGCSHIWLVFGFHHNPSWKPMVLPPRGPKRGVFATRSPYRPNPLGLSCVQLVERQGLNLKILKSDLLDGSPIYDIKPYLAYSDSFPGVQPTWLDSSVSFQIHISEASEKQLQFLESRGLNQLRSFIWHQLEFEPTNHKKKRVRVQENFSVLAYRTWRIEFSIEEQIVKVERLFSGYSEEDLQKSEDPYQDKNLHLEFKKLFPAGSTDLI